MNASVPTRVRQASGHEQALVLEQRIARRGGHPVRPAVVEPHLADLRALGIPPQKLLTLRRPFSARVSEQE